MLNDVGKQDDRQAGESATYSDSDRPFAASSISHYQSLTARPRLCWFSTISCTVTTLVSLRAAYSYPNILVGIAINLILVYIVLNSSVRLEKKIGNAGFTIIRKVFGIILLAIAIKLVKGQFS